MRNSDSPTALRPAFVGRYEVFDVVAHGGMGTIHLGCIAAPPDEGHIVAIKRLHPHYARDAEVCRMMLDEGQLATRILHPNVVTTFDTVVSDGEIFLVMDFLRGESLSRLLGAAAARGERVPLSIGLAVVVGMLLGLHAAHEATDAHGRPLGIVHRDVSPQNVLVGEDGVPRLIDFGVAKATALTAETRSGGVKGKSMYVSPEQLEGNAVDRRSDVFAAGAVLYEVLTGARMFDGPTEAAILVNILRGEPRAPSSVAPDLPAGLDEVVARATRASPDERFATARAMADALLACEAAASEEEVAAWVRDLAREALGSRAALVARIVERQNAAALERTEPDPARPRASPREGIGSERAEEVLTLSQPQTPRDAARASGARDPAEPTRRPRRAVILALYAALAGSLLVGSTFVAAKLRASRQPASEAADPPAGSVGSEQAAIQDDGAAPGSSVPPPPLSEVRDVSPPEAAEAPVTAPSAPVGAPSRATPRHATPRPHARPRDCSRPYVIDAEGHTRFRPECFER